MERSGLVKDVVMEFEQSAWRYQSAEQATPTSHAPRSCIVCESNDVAVTGVATLRPGTPIAVPERVAFCAVCRTLLVDGDVDALVARTPGTALDDFPTEQVRALLTDLRSIPTDDV